MTAQLPSRVRLAQIASFSKSMALPPSNDEIEAMARALLAVHEQEPYWWAIENRHGDARFVEEEHAKNDIWDEVHELNEKDDNGEYFDDNAPYKVVPVYRGPVMGIPQDKYSREMFEKWCTANLERNKWHPDYYAHLPAREQWSAWQAGRDAIEYTHPAPVPEVPMAVAGFDAATAIRACMEEFPESMHDIVEECAQIAENTISINHAKSVPAVPEVPFDGHSPYDVPCSMPSNLRELIAEEISILFSEDDAQGIWTVCRRAAMLNGGKS